MQKVFLLLAFHCLALMAFGQSFSGDARKIGMGGVGDSENIASGMIDSARPYRTFVVPLGLIQLVQDRHYFDPGDDRFNPARLMEDLANPLHLTIGRGADDNGFIEDLVNAGVSRDLNAYRGFVPDSRIVAEGLAAPRFGYLFPVRENRDARSFHGLFFGAGPHLSINTVFNMDDQLRQILAATSNTYVPNTTFFLNNQSSGQVALGITAGYRGRVSFTGRPIDPRFSRNGIYVAGNYHYLHGLRYDAADMQVRFDTDSQGLLTLAPATVPLILEHPYSSSGKGFSLDFGVATVINEWQFGFGAAGLANRMVWDDLKGERLILQSLGTGGTFVEQDLIPASPATRVELPVIYSGNAGYDNGSWAALGEIAHGFQGTRLSGGVEKRFGRIEVRGGTRYNQERWHPSGGVGLNVTSRFAIDVAAFDTTANIERTRKLSIALSLRFNRPAPDR